SSGYLTGRIISRGNLISQVNASGVITGVIAAQGDLGAIQLNPDGTAFIDASGQLVRFGGIDAGGEFGGQIVVLGNLFGDLDARGQGHTNGRIAVKGRS